MEKRIVTSVTLLAFVVYSICGTGCTSITRVPMEEISTIPAKGITQLKLVNGALFSISGRDSEYDCSSERFLSTLPDGSNIIIRGTTVDSVHYITGSDQAEQIQPYGEFRNDELKRASGELRGIIRGLTTFSGRYEFDGRHGRIDSLNHTVIGISKDGDSLNVPFNSIITLKVRNVSATKTALLVLGLGFVGFCVGVGIALHGEQMGPFGG